MECNFSLKHYEECLDTAKKNGYVFLTFNEFAKKDEFEKSIFMRHDIDFQLDVALKMAKLEHKHKIKSTYFVRICGLYNPWNVKVFNILNEISELGHEIGLHYEPGFSKLYNRDINKDLKASIQILESLFLRKIHSIAPHEPVRNGHMKMDNSVLEELGIKHQAYDKKFLESMKYISDSSCRWREGCMCHFINKQTPTLYILTHPFWWFDKSLSENY